MKITKEGEFRISHTDEGSILVSYEGFVYMVMLRKIKRLSNCYKVIVNFGIGTRATVTKSEGIRLAKELLWGEVHKTTKGAYHG